MRSRSLTREERDSILALGKDLKRVWSAPTTTDRDRKELLRTLLDDVTSKVERENYNAHLTLRWRGRLFTEIDVPLPRSHPAPIRTADDTIDLLRRLAALYPDTVIAGILNRTLADNAHVLVEVHAAALTDGESGTEIERRRDARSIDCLKDDGAPIDPLG